MVSSKVSVRSGARWKKSLNAKTVGATACNVDEALSPPPSPPPLPTSSSSRIQGRQHSSQTREQVEHRRGGLDIYARGIDGATNCTTLFVFGCRYKRRSFKYRGSIPKLYIDILFACFGTLVLRHFGIESVSRKWL